MLDSLTLRRALRAPARPIRVGSASLELLDSWQPALLTAIAATCVVSVFAAQLMLALAVAVFLVRVAVGRASLHALSLSAPILAFAVWTMLSASFAEDPVAAHQEAKKLVLFAVLWVAVDSFASRRLRERVVDAALLGGVVLGAGCIVQYYLLGYDTLNNRPIGFLGHYMTSAGLSMVAIVLAVSRLLFAGGHWRRPSRRDWLWLGVLASVLGGLLLVGHLGLVGSQAQRGLIACGLTAAAFALARERCRGSGLSTLIAVLAAPICTWSLLLSQTRSAWLGTLAGLAVVFFLWAPRALAILPVGVLLALAIGPRSVLDRLTVTDESSRDRYYMLQAGIDMIGERPIFGMGPGQIEGVYPRYRWPGAPNGQAPHLHDNALQIAAERGLPCIAWWLWMVIAAMRCALAETRRGARGEGWVAVAALAAWTAVMAGGLFEYNFGDSEIFMILLIVAAMPFALQRQRDGEARREPAAGPAPA